jgi:hypothetical protein
MLTYLGAGGGGAEVATAGNCILAVLMSLCMNPN